MDSPESTWERLVRLLQQASKACREVCPEAGIIIHTEKVNEIDYLQFFYEKMRDVDYDIIGTSYYREWHGDIAGLDRALTMLEQKFSDKVIMDVETNSCQWADEKENYEFTKSELGQNDFTRAVIETLWQHPHVTGLYWWQPEFSIVSLWDQETGRPLLALSTLMTFLNKNSEGHAPDVTFQYLNNPLFSFNLSGWTNTGGTAFWRENTWEMINNYCDFEWTAYSRPRGGAISRAARGEISLECFLCLRWGQQGTVFSGRRLQAGNAWNGNPRHLLPDFQRVSCWACKTWF